MSTEGIPAEVGDDGLVRPSQKAPIVTSPEDQQILDTVGQKYKALAPHMKNAAVVQSPDPGDDRQLEFHHPLSSENPVPGKMTFEMFKPFKGKEREDAIAADALHYLGGRTQDDAGPPVDPKWRDMREAMWNKRTPGQQAIDLKTYGEEHEPGQTFEDWANRNRKDAYTRGGLFPERNPEWNRGPGDPFAFTPDQRAHFAKMSDYLKNGPGPDRVSEAQAANAVLMSRDAAPHERAKARDYLAGLASYSNENKAGPLSQAQQSADYRLTRDPLAEGDADVSDPRWQRLTGNTPADQAEREQQAEARNFIQFAGAGAAGELAAPLLARGVGAATDRIRDLRAARNAPPVIHDPASLAPVERGPSLAAQRPDFFVPRDGDLGDSLFETPSTSERTANIRIPAAASDDLARAREAQTTLSRRDVSPFERSRARDYLISLGKR